MARSITIIPKQEHPTVRYAAEELARVLGIMTGLDVKIDAGAGDRNAIEVGVDERLAAAAPAPGWSPALDDAVSVSVSNCAGEISGANPRSVLLAVYRYLAELGCAWVRPGADGEFVPARPAEGTDADFRAMPTYRHRGICIEGAVSESHVRDIIEWAPRVGMNAYFTQFREAFTFFNRWYTGPTGSKEIDHPFTPHDARAILGRLQADIGKRSLVYHAVGHGWTCEPFGMEGLGWEFPPVNATEETRPYLAEVSGVREVWGGIPLNTNLCYSNPTVRRIICTDIADYASAHPGIDVLHFWLADGSNNNCECEQCAAARPSDFYVRMLNEVDAELSARGLPTRIVFLIYVDLLWPPEREQIANPERFILMFAPITRSYSSAFAPGAELPALGPFERNKLAFPRSVEQNVAHLRAWQEVFSGDSFDFDYHLMWDHYNDPGYTQTARVLAADVRNLGALGLRGLMSCQVQRAFLPTGLPMVAMAQTLWDSSVPYDTVERRYYADAFGPDSDVARHYLNRLTQACCPEALRGDASGRPVDLPRVGDLVAGVRAHISGRVGGAHRCWDASWRYLECHSEIALLLARAYEARERGDRVSAEDHWAALSKYVYDNEPELQTVLDAHLFCGTLGGRFR